MPTDIIRENKPNVFCLHYKECDPKKCTAIKLKKFNLLKIINKIKGNLRNSVILNPSARKEISINDRKLLSKYGLIVIDCSWNKLPNFWNSNFPHDRKLPPLIAANPTNFGVWEKLSSAEALAAALFITKFKSYADLILSKFSWGIQFKNLNNF